MLTGRRETRLGCWYEILFNFTETVGEFKKPDIALQEIFHKERKIYFLSSNLSFTARVTCAGILHAVLVAVVYKGSV